MSINWALKAHPYIFRADALNEFSTFEKLVQTLLTEPSIRGAFEDFPNLLVTFLNKNKYE